MEKPEDRPIGMDFRPAQSVRDAAWALAQAVDRDHGTNNGKTALYWHLMATVAGHATRQKPEDGR